MEGIVDTSIIIDAYRGYQPAIHWFQVNRGKALAITPIVWMEVVQGAPNKRKQSDLIELMTRFIMVDLMTEDTHWAMRQLQTYNLSHSVDLTDALIAAPAYRLQKPLYTRNSKHFIPMIPTLVHEPY